MAISVGNSMSDSNEIRETQDVETKVPGKFALGFLMIGGVLLPAAALLVEMIWKLSAQHFFDPIPTWWHVLLVAFVPVSNLQIYWAFSKGFSPRPVWLSFANGTAIFISLFYALAFAPVMPIAVIGIVFFFLGLLPLAPAFSLIAGIAMRFRLRSLLPDRSSSWVPLIALGASFLFVFTVLGIAEINFTVTRLGMQKANSSDPEVQQDGVALLRKYGDRDHLLRLSYGGPAVVSSNLLVNLFSIDDPSAEDTDVVSKQAQKAYYRLTGRHYRQEPTPHGITRWETFDNQDELDPNGSLRLRKGLSLAVSQIDGSVDPDAAIAYMEWTLVFKNDTPGTEEAIAQIQLPSGGVVSRLTLWINGEEREAAFGKSAKVTEAYDSVTATRRDPALVTLTGKDRIQIKCAPVPANGEMKVRIGITAPAVLEDAESGFLSLPYFQSRNFAMSTEHSVWIESKKDLDITYPSVRREEGIGHVGIRGRISDDDLTNSASPIKIRRSANVMTVWATDTLNGGFKVKQELNEVPKSPVQKLIFVIDASVHLASVQDEVAKAISDLPDGFPIAIVLAAGNGLNSELAAPNYFEGSATDVGAKIAGATFDGGTDAVTAIEKAWEMANATPRSAIVWIHGPQLVELEPPARLAQLWARRPTEIAIYSFQTSAGDNRIERSLNESDAVLTIPRSSSTSAGLAKLFQNLVHDGSSFVAVRTVAGQSGSNSTIGKISAEQAPPSKTTSQHLVRLWANEETLRLLKSGDDAKAIELAVKNQIVTRVSGAVVLETQAQYDQFGLKPVDANTVPSIPEPHEYLLFAVFIIVLAFLGWRLRRPALLTA